MLNKRNSNVGTTLMHLQQQLSHQTKLNDIYLHKKKEFSFNYTLMSKTSQTLKQTKKQKFEQVEHFNNIRRLVEILNKEKTFSDRLKDIHDFYAYPTYFFRQVSQKQSTNTKKSRKTLKKVKSARQISQKSTKITTQKIRQFLPYLTNFDAQDLQLFADGLNKLIITFNIIREDELLQLYQNIIKVLPQTCPQTFRNAIEAMFEQVQQQLAK